MATKGATGSLLFSLRFGVGMNFGGRGRFCRDVVTEV
jgi:hypothetical protein